MHKSHHTYGIIVQNTYVLQFLVGVSFSCGSSQEGMYHISDYLYKS
jgi:hypothetical protein